MTDIQQPKNQKELDLIKKAFKDNESLLKAMRSLFFGLSVSDADKKAIVDTFASDELFAVVSQRFNPQLSPNSEIGQVQDVWLGAEQMVFGQNPDTIHQAVEYKAQAISMVEQALQLLRNPDGARVSLAYAPSMYANDPMQINLLARNQYIRHIETQLLYLWIIAEQGSGKTDEVMKRLEKNSSM